MTGVLAKPDAVNVRLAMAFYAGQKGLSLENSEKKLAKSEKRFWVLPALEVKKLEMTKTSRNQKKKS